MKKVIALLLALVLVFALAACGQSNTSSNRSPVVNTPVTPSTPSTPTTPTTPSESVTPDESETESYEGILDTENPVVIGHLADLTGNESSTGILGQKAVDFAAKLINEQGGIDGRLVVVETYDCQSIADNAVDGIRTLVEDKGAIAIVGPTQIGHKQVAAPVAAEYQVPVMCYNGTPAFLAKKNEYFMSSGGGTAQMPTAMADYLYNVLGLRKIYCISQEGTAGANYVGPLITNFIKLGGEVVGATAEDPTYISVPDDAVDVSPYLQGVTEDADALVGWLSGPQGVSLWTAWYDMGLADKMPLYGAVHGGFTDYFIWKQLNNSRPDVVEKALEIGVYAPINWAYSIWNEVNALFVADWQETYNEVAVGSNLPGAGYTSLLLLKNAIESIEGEVTGAAVYEALQNAEADGAEGHTAFNGEKIATKAVYIAKVVKLDNGDFNYEIVDVYEDVPVSGLTVE